MDPGGFLVLFYFSSSAFASGAGVLILGFAWLYFGPLHLLFLHLF